MLAKVKNSANIRLNNHRNHVKTVVNSCELTDHFLHNQTSHKFDRDINITIIEQIRKDSMTKERITELLRAREVFWQKNIKHNKTWRPKQENGLSNSAIDLYFQFTNCLRH